MAFFGGFDSIIPVPLCPINFDWVFTEFYCITTEWNHFVEIVD